MSVDKTPKKQHSHWLIMVYLAGDNNLSAHSIAFLQELEYANFSRPVNDGKKHARVVAAFDSPTPWPKGARYLEIKRHQDPTVNPGHKMKWPLHNDLVEPGHIVVSPDFCAPDGGVSKKKPPRYPDEPVAEEALARFLDWVKENYEAEKYMLILFGHGPIVAGNTFLADTSPPSYLKLSEFARILCDFGKYIDILACYNCVMNGIESAVQLHGHVNYLLGSQGLMLANGWPVRKIIELATANAGWGSKQMAEGILTMSVLNLLDFTLMERSSEQAVCDVTQFGQKDKIVLAVRALSGTLQKGLKFIRVNEEWKLKYPIVADLVRLARLDAQSYWSETFVDLYDFAALLRRKCKEFLTNIGSTDYGRCVSGPDDLITVVQNIAHWCEKITKIFECDHIVPKAYYVGPQLQYSHGVSIYFPWTLPEGPITFEPIPEWAVKPRYYSLRTPFEEYKNYLFATPEYSDWARFLQAFFRATLRNVRLVEYADEYDPKRSEKDLAVTDRLTVVIDLQKSSSNTGEEDGECLRIKNYPRRFYLSPADCDRRIPAYGRDNNVGPKKDEDTEEKAKVSYLGWNIRGLVAEVVELPEPKK
jgi:hypothetical protein